MVYPPQSFPNLFTTQNVVTSSRTTGTVFQNKTGKPMLVAITGIAGSTAGDGNIFCNSFTPPTTQVARINLPATVVGCDSATFIVPINFFYKMDSSGGNWTIGFWVEYS